MDDTGWEPVDGDWGAEDRDWERLVRQLRNGECTPFIGAGACSAVLPTGAQLCKNLARAYDYPFRDNTDLTQVAQYATFRSFGRINFNQDVAHRLLSRGSDYSPTADAHEILAKFPLPAYLTTNYDDFMTKALVAQHKDPQHLHYPWYFDHRGSDRKAQLPRLRRPTPQNPIVYHLHGEYHHPASMVISESDYHVFLSNLSMEHIGERHLPTPIIGALTQRPLLFVGYSLQDWTFRLLFRGLLKPMESVLLNGHISIQLVPPLVDRKRITKQRAKEYLQDYFGNLNVSVYWGRADSFFNRLNTYLGGWSA